MRLKLVGPAAEHARDRIPAPLGATFDDDADDHVVALGPTESADVSAIARALPNPEELPAGTLVVVLGAIVDPPSLASRFLAVIGRGKTIARAVRATAMVARGYVRVAAGVDRDGRTDLVWGYAPEARSPSTDDVTEPC
jgi:hypothetical protein